MATTIRTPTGLIIGRFCPPHLGHSHLIDVATDQVDQLVVFVNARAGEPIPGSLRAGWLAELHPQAKVVLLEHDLETDFDDPDLWNRWMAMFRQAWPEPEGPDVVFSSEPYGSELARRFGAAEVSVDPGRTTVAISATMIREQPLAHLDQLAPPVRDWVREWAATRS
jgi:HTH-type transcriptional repressor of NAD biosynthesis genes